MKKSVISMAIALAVGTSALSVIPTANAKSSTRFASTINLPSAPIKVNVIIGEDLAYRADHVSPNMRDRNGIRGRHSGWAGQGKYGDKELTRLAERLQERMEMRLTKNGVAISDTASNVLNLVITDARPTRPTFKQLSSDPSLTMQSHGVGGAKFEGTLVSGGAVKGAISYGWYETDIRDAAYGSTWKDANRAIDRFARKTAKSLR